MLQKGNLIVVVVVIIVMRILVIITATIVATTSVPIRTVTLQKQDGKENLQLNETRDEVTPLID